MKKPENEKVSVVIQICSKISLNLWGYYDPNLWNYCDKGIWIYVDQTKLQRYEGRKRQIEDQSVWLLLEDLKSEVLHWAPYL